MIMDDELEFGSIGIGRRASVLGIGAVVILFIRQRTERGLENVSLLRMTSSGQAR